MKKTLLALLLLAGCSQHYHTLTVTSTPSGQQISIEATDDHGKKVRPVGDFPSGPLFTPYEFTFPDEVAEVTVSAGRQTLFEIDATEKARSFDPIEGIFGISSRAPTKKSKMGIMFPTGGVGEQSSSAIEARRKEAEHQVEHIGFSSVKTEEHTTWEQTKLITFYHGIDKVRVIREPVIGLAVWSEETRPQSSSKTLHFDIAQISSQLK